MGLKAAIFDLDGVIVFTDKFHYQAWKQMADEMGIYFDEEINNRLRGVSRMDSLEIFWSGTRASPCRMRARRSWRRRRTTPTASC